MKPQDYIQEAIKTESYDMAGISERLSSKRNIRLLHGAIGMVTEAGELADALKKHIFYGKPLDVVNVREEIQDGLWYIAVICDELGVSFEEMMDRNIAKLRARYGEKFSSEKALNRDLSTEREILEK